MNKEMELYNWIQQLRQVGLTEEEIEGCLDFYEEEWNLWEQTETIN
jgi:hypothetical protein